MGNGGQELEVWHVPLREVSDGTRAMKRAVRGRSIREGRMLGMAVYPEGTASGKHAVGFVIELQDGTVVHAQTTAKLMMWAASALGGMLVKAGEGIEVGDA